MAHLATALLQELFGLPLKPPKKTCQIFIVNLEVVCTEKLFVSVKEALKQDGHKFPPVRLKAMFYFLSSIFPFPPPTPFLPCI